MALGEDAVVGDSNRLFNVGTLEAPTNAVIGGVSDETVINQGTIIGEIVLEGGNDTYDGRGGTLNGAVHGGVGDDLYIIDDTGIQLVEAADEGTDTVESEVSFRLPANFEALILIGGGAKDGYGNVLDNALTGNLANNLLNGGNGNDTLDGREGDDTLRGNRGDDTFLFSVGDDTILGGLDADTLDYSGAGEAVIVDLTAGTAATSDTLDILHGIENVIGTAEDDAINGKGQDNVLDGGDSDDTIHGRNGNDWLLGGDGRDVMDGGNGDDVLAGGSGVDVMTGGSGADSWRFLSTADSGFGGANRDRITDFEQGIDLIDVSTVDAHMGLFGDQSFSFIGASSFSGTAGELRYVNQGTQTRVLGDVDGDTAADFEVLVMTGLNLSAGDFIL